MSLTQIPAKVGKALMKKYSKKGGRRRKAVRTSMPKAITGNFASRKEQFSLAVTAGQVYDFTFNLGDMVPCQALAGLYQYYRITSVELRFKPNFDTYVSGGSAGTGILPNLNFQYDKAGVLQGTMDANNFEQLGTKAIRMDDKTIVRKWKPSVLTLNPTPGASSISQFKVAPWLPTHLLDGTLNEPDHYGACWYISKSSPADGQVYDVDVVVNVQFRKPYIKPSSSSGVSVNPPRAVQTVEGVVAKMT